jgi:flagellar hook-associated protein 2
MSTAIAGIASGFDWQSLVDQLAEVERAPQATLLAEQTKIQERNNSFGALKTQLGVLRNRVTTLKDPTLYDSRTGASSNSALGTASVSAGATVGKYTFAISQLATASLYTGTSGVGQKLSANDITKADLAGPNDVALSSAGFATAITAGTFTVNGKQVTIEAADTMAGVFKKIYDATGGDAGPNTVTAAYGTGSDKLTLTSGSTSPIVLGSATDTSNFLQVAKLYSNNATNITSGGELGSVKLSGTLSSANFTTAVTGGTAGEFEINGVSIKYNSTSDSVADVLNRINSSTAGVVASYDSVNDRFSLSNKSTGSVGIALNDKTGNFLKATGMLNTSGELAGSLTLGDNLLYTVNGGGQLTSQSNTISAASSGLTGLSVTALTEATTDNPSFTVTVGVDTAKIKSAITGFTDAYNATQAMISSSTASSTDAKGKVTAGILADDPEATSLSSELRALANSTISGLTGSVSRFESLGIKSNGYDDNLATSDLSNLDTALADNLASVRDFFTNTTSGMAVSFDSFLESTIGDKGTMTAHQDTLTKQAAAINPQIVDMEKLVQSEIDRLTMSFVAMEQAQAQNNQVLAYLNKTFA